MLNGNPKGVVSVYTDFGSTSEGAPEIYRRVLSRRVYPNGGTGNTFESKITFSQTEGQGTATSSTTVDNYDLSGNLRARGKHYFHGNPIPAESTLLFEYPIWNHGKEYQSEQFDILNATPVLNRSSNNTWQPGTPIASNPTAPINARISEIVSALIDTNQLSKRTFGHDQYNNVTDRYEYDFGSGAGGGLVRRSHTDYLTTNPVNGWDYTSASIHIRNLPTQQWISTDAAGSNKVSLTTYAYDQYGLADCPNVTGHDTAFTTGYLTRGNPTSVTGFTDAAAATGAITSTSHYDVAGNVVSATDPKGNTSTVSYLDSFSDALPRNTYAFPTSATSAVPDPTGQYGSTSALTTASVYDYTTGQVTSSTDANNKTTTFEYNDPLDRLTKVNLSDGGRTTYIHVDTHQCGAYVETRTLLDSTGSEADSFQFFDGLGRPKRSFTLENQDTNNPYLTVDTQYDAMGRAWSVSNPYRSPGCTSAVNPSGRWTQTTFDALSRPKQVVTTADGAAVTSDYSGNTVTVTDQAGKKRRSVTDALGRLTRVDEPDSTGNLGPTSAPAQPTTYTYDVLGNLRKVGQGVQQRFFMYDSLSRLIRAKNPEQAAGSVISNIADAITGNTQWSMGYAYDNNGNLTTRIDARNITTTYAYDALNRNTTVRYTDGTKDIDSHYDGAINGKGRFWYSNWDQSNNTRFDSHVAVDDYDAMGRPKNYRQHFLTNGVASPQFNVKHTYNLAGQMLTQTYPSGHTVNFGYDEAGRINSYAGNLGDGVARTYSTGISYSEFGGLQQEQFGTQTPLYHKLHHNVRGQLYDVRLSTVAWATDQWNWNRGCLALYFGYAHQQSGPLNNGNVSMMQHFVPANDSMTDYSYTEDRYSYDTLNRLASTNEVHGGPWGVSGQDYIQTSDYDRYGNRTINQSQTSTNIPRPNYTVDTNTNRLIAPIGFSYAYDAAGNQTTDNYTGAGSRTYDGENHLKQAWANNQWQTYTYDADGRRIKRNVNGAETWQVYGMSGELLAEYKSGAAPFLPSKEYGYRGGQLLVTVSSGDDLRLKRFLQVLYYGALQVDAPSQWMTDKSNELAAAGAQSQAQLLVKAKEIARALFVQTNYETNPPSRSNTQYVTDLYYAYLQRGPDDSGLYWWAVTVLPGSTRANVCNAFEDSSEFATLVATLYGTATSDNERTEHFVNNFYLGAYGRNATSTELQQQRDALNAAAAQGLSQVQAQAESFGRSLFVSQVNDAGLSNTQFVTNLYEAFLQRGPDAGGLGWWSGQASVGSGRQNVLNAFATCGPFYELAGTLYREAFWLVTDHLGTPRMIVNKSGSLPGVKRHDYLPFGEELYAGIGGRTTTQGYTGDSVRQKFTLYERDAETLLDFAQARYYGSAQGRFTSVDPLMASAEITRPQSWNRYAYVENSPLNFTDPSGLKIGDFTSEEEERHGSIITTGYDPALGIYRGVVQVEYIPDSGGYPRTITLNNPTPEELEQTIDYMIVSSDLLVAQKKGPVTRGSGRSSPKNDPRNWAVVETGRGKRQYRYIGPRPWSEALGHPLKAVPGVPYHRHHLFPQEFRGRFEQLGINIDSMTVWMPATQHRKLHPRWNADWANFFARNPRASSRDVYKFGVEMMFRHHLYNYQVVPYTR